ncbi:RNA degradosome polyphosphate kinase [Texcoconibacillus texcoconensis]|uniref:Polyphosphate kinase n=1 Tax=Texcoconibacillus texcoconensis TaxID=1095777 RepID=A0A840QRG5_9BACI|nr:RNA degradosome polyphosphate kinase [Texcoconibacillus texcoconensis]MBB5173911.1 polyphosphate kinase [Texcoconibacillus texcoconensis]
MNALKRLDDNRGHFEDPSFYNNRELSWLEFNKRVLQEAIDKQNPLLERLKFLAIFSSNLDEFFMVRVAGLQDQVKANFHKPDNKTNMTPKEQLEDIGHKTKHLVRLQNEVFNTQLEPLLKKENISLLDMKEVSHTDLHFLENTFKSVIFPVLTPMAIDVYRPFPLLSSKSLHIAVKLRDHLDKRNKLAIIQVPGVLKRYIELPRDNGNKAFILLEDVVTHFISELFPGYEVLSTSQFRITRNADLTIHEEGARDLLLEIEKELEKRKWGAVVRFEMKKGNMDPTVLKFLIDIFKLHDQDIYEIDGPLDPTFLFSFYQTLKKDFKHLINKQLPPQKPVEYEDAESLFETIANQDMFFHHPYESFQPIVDMIQFAATDPNVLAIKQTLYRVSGESPIVQALAEAAERGKQVTVLVELKARFDEENNIQWARTLEKSGVHVIYGISGLKTHAKVTVIVRRHKGSVRRFVHLGTGNYNDSTAKLYTDMGYLTSCEQFGRDATNFFNYLSGYRSKPSWSQIETGPFDIRNRFLTLIDEEISYHKKHGQGHIIAKMNALTDKPIIMKLYEASQAGVQIDLIVRGTCCLRPKRKGVSENITVRSIVGRFLEHSRVFYFYRNGEEATFLSSADWMTRNMEKRIEILFPIHDDRIKRQVKQILDITLQDNSKAREQQSDGTYTYITRKQGEASIQSQLILYEWALSLAKQR